MQTRCISSRFHLLSLFQIALLSFSCITARATTVRSLDLAELVRQAALIADVTVVSVEPYLASSSGQSMVKSRVVFKLNRPALKGQVAAEFSLEFLGGTVGNRKMVVVGIPQFEPGQRLILFSYGPSSAYASPIVGLNQGAIRVVRDEQNNVDRVYRWAGTPINSSQPSNAQGSTSAAPDELRSADALDQFIERINKLMAP